MHVSEPSTADLKSVPGFSGGSFSATWRLLDPLRSPAARWGLRAGAAEGPNPDSAQSGSAITPLSHWGRVRLRSAASVCIVRVRALCGPPCAQLAFDRSLRPGAPGNSHDSVVSSISVTLSRSTAIFGDSRASDGDRGRDLCGKNRDTQRKVREWGSAAKAMKCVGNGSRNVTNSENVALLCVLPSPGAERTIESKLSARRAAEGPNPDNAN